MLDAQRQSAAPSPPSAQRPQWYWGGWVGWKGKTPRLFLPSKQELLEQGVLFSDEAVGARRRCVYQPRASYGHGFCGGISARYLVGDAIADEVARGLYL